MHAVPGEPLYRWAQSAREVVVTSPISPLYLPYISPTSPLYLPAEVVVTLPLPAGVRSRAISCTFKTTQLRAALKGAAEPLLHIEVPHTSALPRPTSPHPPVSLRPRSSRRVA